MNLLYSNLRSLEKQNRALCERISNAHPNPSATFVETSNGHIVPGVLTQRGLRLLHSRVDPVKEAQRIADRYTSPGTYVFFGLGGGFIMRPFLARASTELIIIIDYDLDSIRAICEHIDMRWLFDDPRTRLLIDENASSVTEACLSYYIPYLHGNLTVVALHQRISMNQSYFTTMYSVLGVFESTVARDTSTQSRFGRRWLKNIIANAGAMPDRMPSGEIVDEFHIIAAGPSLERSIPYIKSVIGGRSGIIATDTSLPLLLHEGISPDYAISIDCQHHSYHHFFGELPDTTILVLSLSSAPSLARRCKRVQFMADGHPFSQYLSQKWCHIPTVDTSGGNVTHSALSLAYQLGAIRVVVHGADFSYPKGKSYARKTYLYPLFHSCQARRTPLESLFTRFILDNQTLTATATSAGISYTNEILTSYKKALEEYASVLPVQCSFFGKEEMRLTRKHIEAAPERIRATTLRSNHSGSWPAFAAGILTLLQNLPYPTGPIIEYVDRLDVAQRDLVTAFLPYCAFAHTHGGTASDIGSRLLARALHEAIELLADQG
ncbi:MAG: hypothetical protein CMN78_01710 [Spirochaetales bacterium]|nr:hypothetical protein [Spirochaetales bacterium]